MKRKNMREYIGAAGVVSLTGLIFGWCAIVLIISGLPYLAIIAGLSAFFLDCLDGFVARKTKTVSEFGRQLDGSFDLINYLVFSALFVWKYLTPNLIGILMGFIIIATGTLRLVRFNIEGFVVRDKELYYEGLVVCHVSLTVVLLFFLKQLFPILIWWLAPPVMLVVSLLQTSRLPIKKTNTYIFWLGIACALLIVTCILQLWHR